MGEVAHRVIRKNEGNQSDLPLTISAQHGLVDQRGYFNNQVASRDMSGYYLLENGEFAYNKSTSGDSPWGVIKRLTKYEKGCLSTLYICFGLDLGDPDFLVAYYETNRWHGAVQMIAAEGARNHGLLNIAPDDFFETALTLPCSTEEQKQIGCFFIELNSLITLHQRKRCNRPFTHPLVWEQRKLGDCFDFLQNNTLSRADLNSESGGARNIHYGDILIKFGDCLGLDSGKLPFADDKSILSKYANSTLRIGDVIFADTAEDESAGKCVELVKLPNEPVISGLHTIPARPKFPFGSGYLGHYLNAPAYHDQLLPLLQGIKVVSISKTALQDTQICFPTALEQSAIGAFLSALDSLITLHQ